MPGWSIRLSDGPDELIMQWGMCGWRGWHIGWPDIVELQLTVLSWVLLPCRQQQYDGQRVWQCGGVLSGGIRQPDDCVEWLLQQWWLDIQHTQWPDAV